MQITLDARASRLLKPLLTGPKVGLLYYYLNNIIGKLFSFYLHSNPVITNTDKPNSLLERKVHFITEPSRITRIPLIMNFLPLPSNSL